MLLSLLLSSAATSTRCRCRRIAHTGLHISGTVRLIGAFHSICVNNYCISSTKARYSAEVLRTGPSVLQFSLAHPESLSGKQSSGNNPRHYIRGNLVASMEAAFRLCLFTGAMPTVALAHAGHCWALLARATAFRAKWRRECMPSLQHGAPRHKHIVPTQLRRQTASAKSTSAAVVKGHSEAAGRGGRVCLGRGPD